MFGQKFQRKYALTDQGVRNVKKGTFWTVIVNLTVMGGMSILYLMMSGFMGTLTAGQPLPNLAFMIALVVAFVALSIATHLQQYKTTYGLVYNEVKATRLSLAERLRKLPLGYFGKRDLADLTETLMGDVNRMEHVWSHVLGYLYGAYISISGYRGLPAGPTIGGDALPVCGAYRCVRPLSARAGCQPLRVRTKQPAGARIRRHSGSAGKRPGDSSDKSGGAVS